MLQKRKVLPPLDYLVAFEAAAREGGFAGAARRLNLSETAISRKVRLLEQHYDVALFVRGHRSVTLTAQGHALLDGVSSALDGLRAVSQDMFARHHKNAVTLAATNSVAALWLLPRLRRFNAANARVKISLVASDSDAECLAETSDLSILRGDGDWPGYEARKLFGETVFPVCSPGYLRRHGAAATLTALPSLDLIEVASAHAEWMTWTSWLSQHGIEGLALDRSASFNTYPLAVQAAVDGLGIALGWGHLVDRYLEDGSLVRPLGDAHVRTASGYYLLRRKGTRSFPERQTVEDWLAKQSDARRRYG